MAVRPQEELPGLEGSSEVILSLSLPPGRTAPPPANPHTQWPPQAAALRGRRPPSSASTPEPRGLIPPSGTFLRFNLDPFCCGPQPVACVSRGWVSWGHAVQRMRSQAPGSALSWESSQGLPQHPSPTAVPPGQGR